jgi:methylmalonyl-CoA mutase N-terminal domain/subunit
MERQCYAYFDKIDQLGGMVNAVKEGYPQREIAESAYELQLRTDRGERIVVGVNEYTEGDSGELETLRIDPALERKQIDRLQGVKARRDTEAVEAALTAIRNAAANEDENLVPHFITAAEAHVSEGEIVMALQEVWGSYRETPVF